MLKKLLLITIMIITGCEDNEPVYYGDGVLKFLPGGAPLAVDGFSITFPEMDIFPGAQYEYSMFRMPEAGRYLLYLSLPYEVPLERMDYVIEIFQNQKLKKKLDTRNNSGRHTMTTSSDGFVGLYLFSLDPEKDSSLNISSLNDQWKIRIKFRDTFTQSTKLTGHLLLKTRSGK